VGIGGGWVTGDQPMIAPVYQGVKYDYTGVYGWAIREEGLGPCAPDEVYPYLHTLYTAL
jgi:hypothetical protein